MDVTIMIQRYRRDTCLSWPIESLAKNDASSRRERARFIVQREDHGEQLSASSRLCCQSSHDREPRIRVSTRVHFASISRPFRVHRGKREIIRRNGSRRLVLLARARPPTKFASGLAVSSSSFFAPRPDSLVPVSLPPEACPLEPLRDWDPK